MRCLAALAVMAAAPAAADQICDDLWFTRNLVMDRAGQCFQSPLGQTIFDNSDCSPGAVSLHPEALELVERVRAREAEVGCAVDTSRRILDLPDQVVRRLLSDLPVRDMTESACLGWRGAPAPLRLGRSGVAPVVGRVEAGDSVLSQHEGGDDWSYVTVTAPDGGLRAAGWMSESANPWDCEMMAG